MGFLKKITTTFTDKAVIKDVIKTESSPSQSDEEPDNEGEETFNTWVDLHLSKTHYYVFDNYHANNV